MESLRENTLLEALERYRVRRFTGRLTIENEYDGVAVWFVRGNLTHVENRSGETGWKALEAVKGGLVKCAELMDDLPPQRSIRVETGRLLKAMRASTAIRSEPRMHVPVPLHLRLQSKFTELRGRFSGLRAYEVGKRDATSCAGHESDGQDERVILERDPRGCTWTHLRAATVLTVRGDENAVTSDVISAGEELWRELEKLSQEFQNHDE